MKTREAATIVFGVMFIVQLFQNAEHNEQFHNPNDGACVVKEADLKKVALCPAKGVDPVPVTTVSPSPTPSPENHKESVGAKPTPTEKKSKPKPKAKITPQEAAKKITEALIESATNQREQMRKEIKADGKKGKAEPKK